MPLSTSTSSSMSSRPLENGDPRRGDGFSCFPALRIARARPRLARAGAGATRTSSTFRPVDDSGRAVEGNGRRSAMGEGERDLVNTRRPGRAGASRPGARTASGSPAFGPLQRTTCCVVFTDAARMGAHSRPSCPCQAHRRGSGALRKTRFHQAVRTTAPKVSILERAERRGSRWHATMTRLECSRAIVAVGFPRRRLRRSSRPRGARARDRKRCSSRAPRVYQPPRHPRRPPIGSEWLALGPDDAALSAERLPLARDDEALATEPLGLAPDSEHVARYRTPRAR